MASSVDSIHADADGAGSGARTPTRPAQASSAGATAAASELSPPGSQPQQSSEFSTISSLAAVPDSDISGTSNGADAPIAAWKSKRAQEEYQRAMESVIDQDFNLSMSNLE
jgi:hypothetical protein